MSDDLVERVARAACASVNSADTWEETGTDVHEMVWFPIARAAIAVVLEEAAKVAGKWQQMYFEDEKVHSSNITEYIVSDIRALIKEPT